jgi:uncharacterized protein involved in exopolysaccharide biosynthesis
MLQTTTAAAADDRDEMVDNRELIAILWKRRWLIAASTVIFGVLLGVVAFLMTPIYRGSAILVPASADTSVLGGSALGSLGGVAALAGINVSGRDSAVEEALAVLKSRQFTQDFIVRNHLLPELFRDLWDDRAEKWKAEVKEPPTLNRAYQAFDGIRKVIRDTKTGLITLQVDWRDRTKAAEWTNELVRQLNEEMRSRAITEADASMGYLEKELNVTSEVPTREAISKLIETQVKQRMLANVTQEYSLRFVDRALPVDVTDRVAPRRILMIGAGMITGLVAGCTLAVLLNMWEVATRRRR